MSFFAFGGDDSKLYTCPNCNEMIRLYPNRQRQVIKRGSMPIYNRTVIEPNPILEALFG